LEEDKAIFDALLSPLIRPIETVPVTKTVVPTPSDDPDAEDVVIPHVVKKIDSVSKSLLNLFFFNVKHYLVFKYFSPYILFVQHDGW